MQYVFTRNCIVKIKRTCIWYTTVYTHWNWYRTNASNHTQHVYLKMFQYLFFYIEHLQVIMIKAHCRGNAVAATATTIMIELRKVYIDDSTVEWIIRSNTSSLSNIYNNNSKTTRHFIIIKWKLFADWHWTRINCHMCGWCTWARARTWAWFINMHCSSWSQFLVIYYSGYTASQFIHTFWLGEHLFFFPIKNSL